MASQNLLVLSGNKQKRLVSSAETVDFLSIKVGASALEMKETSGHFDFAAKKLTNMAAGAASGEAVEYDQFVDELANYILASEKGANNGVATLDGSGKVPV